MIYSFNYNKSMIIMKSPDFLLWLSPLFTVFAGLLLFFFKKFKKIRIATCLVVLFVTFLFDLTSISFQSDYYDLMLLLLATLFVSEVFWNILRIKQKKIIVVFLVLGIAGFFLTFKEWINQGPVYVTESYNTSIISRYAKDDQNYILKENNKSNAYKTKTIKLYRLIKLFHLEQHRGTFQVPDSYLCASFKFKWRLADSGVMVDLVGNSDTLWTLKDAN